MSNAPQQPRQPFHGKLNLEQQKKRAKALLKALHQQDGSATARFNRYGLDISKAQLSDAQWLLAQENGFKQLACNETAYPQP